MGARQAPSGKWGTTWGESRKGRILYKTGREAQHQDGLKRLSQSRERKRQRLVKESLIVVPAVARRIRRGKRGGKKTESPANGQVRGG